MYFHIVNGALLLMQTGPRPIAKALAASAAINDDHESCTLPELQNYLKSASPGDETVGVFRATLARWDNESSGSWIGDTAQNSVERRALIYRSLELGEEFIEICDTQFPFHHLEQPVVIAQEHTIWYTPEVRQARNFYWTAYTRQLRSQGWAEDSIQQLDESTSSVVERLSDPSNEEAYQSKGLVVGYVQSGKTANFTGVIAKAGDAGYKLIIVLAGMLDVLRSQTQRRVDKDMVGRELLDSDYERDSDWLRFLSHGGMPSILGSFDWYRLTGPESDYRQLKKAVDALKFEASDQSKPLWHRDNLFQARTRIAIVKKNSKVLARVLDDLRLMSRNRLGAPLNQIPTLIIDDESDQASVNADPDERTKTNQAIVDLLRILPRAQYVGYTATPFANVFVDPNNEEDIFPKDFLISLPRPDGYMGVSDFYDLDGSPDDPDTRPNEVDFIRAVQGADEENLNLRKALDSYVLSGAIKLFRQAHDKGLNFRHHTMLVHSSPNVADHTVLAGLVRELFARSGYDGGKGLDRLADLFVTDFQRVSIRRREGFSFPKDFSQLTPFIGECLTNVGGAKDAVLEVNNENPSQTPNFDKEAVWKILVGGNKLSRGYTIEGLTVSYYRRRAQTADTLMQMGRWFGFRKGYRDLVRLFIGTHEPLNKNQTKFINLYEAFGAICRDEEMFRDELKKYAGITEPRITPRQIPPLVPSHMLKPTSANKMYNARISYQNFGDSLSESTYAPQESEGIEHNNKLISTLLDGVEIRTIELSAKTKTKIRPLSANIAILNPNSVLSFISQYHWFDKNDPLLKSGSPMLNQIAYLKGTGQFDPGIDDWILLSPHITKRRGAVKIHDLDFSVVFRDRANEEGTRFTTYNDPHHRAYAEHICGQNELEQANDALKTLRQAKRAVMIYYSITDSKDGDIQPPFSVGFTLLFPKNEIKVPVRFSVVRPDRPEAVVVQS